MGTRRLLRLALLGTALCAAACSSSGGATGLHTDRDRPLTISPDDPAAWRGGLKAKILPDGRQDTGEVLRIDTRALPAHTKTETVTVEVG